MTEIITDTFHIAVNADSVQIDTPLVDENEHGPRVNVFLNDSDLFVNSAEIEKLKYNTAGTLPFEFYHAEENPLSVNVDELRNTIQRKLAAMTDKDLLQAVLNDCWDTQETEL